ncbi:MAG TPA: O-methyltransferase [Candidatus Eremiobacteraceae bacterium]|nr:O-methyltransferase [Candidatus Eremiobacteraceae bacterium]
MNDPIRVACHDLNNALGTILVSADVGGKRAGADADRECFDAIAAGARRAGELVAQIPLLADSPVERDLEYLMRSHPEPPPVIVELEEHCKRDEIPLMERSGVQLLAALVAAARADSILELGTAYGYSAIWMALAQGPSGRIVTVDPDTARTDIAKSYFVRTGVAQRIDVVNRPALDAIASMRDATFDLVFIDAVKEEYPAYLDAVLPHIRQSGVVVVDNLLWHHRASAAPAKNDEQSTVAIRDFSRTFMSHPSLRAVIVPVGDGVGFAVKTGPTDTAR